MAEIGLFLSSGEHAPKALVAQAQYLDGGFDEFFEREIRHRL